MATPAAKELKRVPLFAALSDHDRAFLATYLDEMDFGPGVELITEGRSNHTFFVLREGEVEISVQAAPTCKLGPGDFFGEISMDQLVPATATVVTKTPVRVYVMSHSQFRAVIGNEPVLLRLRAAMLERLLADRERRRL
jgi:CRP/FNR family transcriptional regulator, cyclic AMP receptor protein